MIEALLFLFQVILSIIIIGFWIGVAYVTVASFINKLRSRKEES